MPMIRYMGTRIDSKKTKNRKRSRARNTPISPASSNKVETTNPFTRLSMEPEAARAIGTSTTVSSTRGRGARPPPARRGGPPPRPGDQQNHEGGGGGKSDEPRQHPVPPVVPPPKPFCAGLRCFSQQGPAQKRGRPPRAGPEPPIRH